MTGALKDPRFVTLDAAAHNGGVPAPELAGAFLTPTSRLFVRSHGATPAIDPTAWRLTIDGLVDRSASLSFADLQQFPRRDVAATLICAGMRRKEFLALGPLPGELPWGGEPIGTVRWSGISLIDVLDSAGIAPTCSQIEFIGLDEIERHGERFGFGASIPLDKARDSDVLLAFELNGAPLSPAHGFPVRAVVPGWIGARSVKWLGHIRGTDAPTDNYFRTKAYRLQRTANPGLPRDVSAGEPIEEVTLNSAILAPESGARLPTGPITVTGWALGTNATSIDEVEISQDAGATWTRAELEPETDRWAWRMWHASVMLGQGPCELVVRATDRLGNRQPESVQQTWNVKGYANNAWHRVSVTGLPE